MKQDIRFKGLNLALDEQVVENGALAVCDGMEMCGGALRPCVIEGVRQTAEINGEILYIHEMTNGRKNAIFAVDNDEGLVIDGVTYPKNSLIYQDLSSTEPKPLMAEDNLTRSIINSVTSNGNTLVMLTTKGIRYFRWYENAYKYLGKMPELNIEFSLRTDDFIESQEHDYIWQAQNNSFELSYDVDGAMEYDDKSNLLAREQANEAAIGMAHQYYHKKGYFTLPFFVRYCYRLWDGRKVMHSSPVLMFTNLLYPEMVIIGLKHQYEENTHLPLLMPQKLHMALRGNVDIFDYEQTLDKIKEDWRDIITGIDIYVTPGIANRDESITIDIPSDGEYPSEGKWKCMDSRHHSYSDEREKTTTLTLINSYIDQKNFAGLFHNYALYADTEHGSKPFDDNVVDGFHFSPISLDFDGWWQGLWIPQPLGYSQYKKRLEEQNAYYLIKRYDLRKEEIPANGYVEIDEGVLDNIEAQEQMMTSTAPDDYRTHNEIIAQTSYVYNNRINLTGIQEIPFNGFPLCTLVPAMRLDIADDDPAYDYQAIDVIVRLDNNGDDIYVRREYAQHSVNPWYLNNGFIFYPDSRAKEMWIYDSIIDHGDARLLAHIPLLEHPFLNGAYHMGDLSNPTSSKLERSLPDSTYDTITIDKITENPRFDLPNYIFTSASGNPFVFPAAHRYAVGLGSVLAIASTTRALSQGQFGQYPMIAFATDGIYALEISSTGSYSGIQPISREVITNPRSLLQLDQSIAFVTRRAVNQLVSSDVTSLSDMLNGALRDLSEMLKGREGETVIPSTGQVDDLIGAMQDAQGIYDFVNTRLLYFLKDGDAFTGDVLVFCANDGAWAYKSLGDDIIKGIYNSYPYPYIHKTDGSIECLSAPYDNMEEGSYSGLVVTRTIKTEGVRNAIREFFQDYDFGADTDKPTLMLWGSNDNRTWHYIGRSNARQMGRLPGRIYRYFRLAVKFEGMKRNDLYHGVQLDIVERFTR